MNGCFSIIIAYIIATLQKYIYLFVKEHYYLTNIWFYNTTQKKNTCVVVFSKLRFVFFKISL